MQVTIRNAGPEDLDAAVAIEKACFSEADAASKDRLKERLEALKTTFLLAECDGKPVGLVDGCITSLRKLEDRMYASCELHDESAPNIMVFGVAVLPEYRHLGIATIAMKRLEDDARKRGKALISLTCKDRYITFYEKLGYVNEGVSTSTHGGAKWYDMTLFL